MWNFEPVVISAGEHLSYLPCQRGLIHLQSVSSKGHPTVGQPGEMLDGISFVRLL